MKTEKLVQAVYSWLLRSRISGLILKAVRRKVELLSYNSEMLAAFKTDLWRGQLFWIATLCGVRLSLPNRVAASFLSAIAAEESKFVVERITATSLLGLLQTDGITDRLIGLCFSSCVEVRSEALRMLRRYSTKLGRFHSELQTLVRSEPAAQALAIAIELAEIVDRGLVPDVADTEYWGRLLDTKHFELRLAVYRVLQKRGQLASHFADVIGMHLADEGEIEQQSAQIATIVAIATDQALPVQQIAACLNRGNVRLAVTAFEALGKLGPRAKAALPQLTLEMLGRNNYRRKLATEASVRIFDRQVNPDGLALLRAEGTSLFGDPGLSNRALLKSPIFKFLRLGIQQLVRNLGMDSVVGLPERA